MSERQIWLYRRLLAILPRAFRREAEHELVETFRESHARATLRGGFVRLRFWFRTVADLVVTAVQERHMFDASSVVADVRVGIRSLRRTPGFLMAALVTFAIDIGLTIAALSVVARIVYLLVPHAHEAQLVYMHKYHHRTDTTTLH